MRIKHPFNLIEISIALGVIAVGIVAVVGAFPLAANKTRNAMAEGYAASSASDMLALIEQKGRDDWATWFEGNTYVPAAKPGGADRRNLLPNTQGCIYDTIEKGTYHIVRFVDRGGAAGVFDDGTDILDFEAEMRLWRDQANYNGSSPIPYAMAVKLNAEISWPAAAPYANRQKAYYTTELFKR